MSGYEKWDEADWQDARDTMRSVEETYHGPVVGYFTITETAQNGPHPKKVREAWKGVQLPVRTRHMYDGEETINILCTDGYNALVEAGKDEGILQYWIDLLDGRTGENDTFAFNTSDGAYHPLS
jgi:hypothetical protein